jgi:hypothetical protein
LYNLLDATQSKIDREPDKLFKDEDSTISSTGASRTIQDESDNLKNIKLGVRKDMDQGDVFLFDENEIINTKGPVFSDAISYVNAVKFANAGDPRVYNRFINILKDFESGAIDVLGVIKRIPILFAKNLHLIEGFNTFLPPGYRVECGTDGNGKTIRVIIPGEETVYREVSGLGTAYGEEEINVDDEKAWEDSDGDSEAPTD